MNKLQLCLAMSSTLSIGQVNLLPVQAQSSSGAIWQKLSAANAIKPASSAKRAPVKTAQKAAPSTNAGHAMLFLSSKPKATNALGAVPTAALSIHPALSLDTASATAPAVTPSAITNAAPQISAVAEPVAIESTDSAPVLAAKPGNSSNQLLAQLAPDQVIAQADQTTMTASPIPPVVTGTVDLEEFKTTNVLDLKVSQSRTFKLKNKIVRTSISDPAVAEPVVVSENQIVLLGKTPGSATLVLWDDAGNSVAIDLRVTRDYAQLQSTLREIDPRIIVKAFSVGGADRVLLLGDVDHTESVVRAFSASNVFMDDRGMNVQVSNNRLVNGRIGEQSTQGGGAAGGGQTGQLAQLSSVDKYTFFPNTTNNVGKAQVITSDGGRVTSLVKVRKMPLIVLHVTFMEMNTTAARELGVQLGFNYGSKNFAFGIGGNNNVANAQQTQLNFAQGGSGAILQPGVFFAANQIQIPNPGAAGGTVSLPISNIGLGALNQIPSLLSTAVLLGAPGGASFSPGGLANLFTGAYNYQSGANNYSLNPTVQGIIAHQRARILAEPTLVTISGERASFLAGGEIPILQSIATAGAAQQSVTFEPFGLRINMIPMLLENGSLNIEISPEERIVSTQNQLNIPGSSSFVPGFTTRKSQTIVEMKPGQELFIAGLISSNNGRELTKTPVIGEVPVLGALYRSKAFTKNESELVVAIRPEIILPGTPGQLKLPEEIGRVEGPRDANLFQVEPTVIDERHYTSGRSERHQKTSPTLPEGSPIPDNE
jgi:Flp pilus assembly secretin CpaC